MAMGAGVQQPLARAVGPDQPEGGVMAVELDEHDQPAVGRPIRRAAAVSQPPEPPAIGADDVETFAALEDEMLAIGRPGRGVALRQTPFPGAIHVHDPNLVAVPMRCFSPERDLSPVRRPDRAAILLIVPPSTRPDQFALPGTVRIHDVDIARAEVTPAPHGTPVVNDS